MYTLQLQFKEGLSRLKQTLPAVLASITRGVAGAGISSIIRFCGVCKGGGRSGHKEHNKGLGGKCCEHNEHIRVLRDMPARSYHGVR